MSDPRPSRRALLKGTATTGAAAALLAMPAAALQPDPVFAAVAAHKVANDQFLAALHEEGEYEHQCWARGDQDDNPAWLDAKISEASASETAARELLIGTAPTTTAGALAYIGHLTGWSCFGGGISIEREDFHAVMATLRIFIAKGAAA